MFFFVIPALASPPHHPHPNGLSPLLFHPDFVNHYRRFLNHPTIGPARAVSGVNGLSVTVLNGSPERRDIGGGEVKGKIVLTKVDRPDLLELRRVDKRVREGEHIMNEKIFLGSL